MPFTPEQEAIIASKMAPAQAPSEIPSGGDARATFVRDHGPLAERIAADLNVDPDAVLGQWGLETGWGKSVIPGTNNLGNIKDFSGKGTAATDNMTGSRDKYRQYASLDDFGNDFSGLVQRRYGGAMGTGQDVRGYARALKAGGYAEDPAYEDKLVSAAESVKRIRGLLNPAKERPASVRYFDPADQPGASPADFERDTRRADTARAAGPTLGDYARTFAGSAVQGAGDILGGAGEAAASAMNAWTGTEDYAGFNPLKKPADAIRNGMTEGGRLARADTFDGDLFDSSTWKTPDGVSGWLMTATDGLGSLVPSILPALGPAARAARLAAAGDAVGAAAASTAAKVTGAATGGLMTAGSAATDARTNIGQALGKMSHDQLMADVPIYRDAFDRTGDQKTARNAVENSAAQFAGMGAGLMGAAGGVFNAKIIEDLIAHKGVSALLGSLSKRATVRGAVGAGAGMAAEGGQEVSEGVGQAMGENYALGRPLSQDVTRGSLGNFIGGALVGTAAGGVGGVLSRAASHAPAPQVAPGVVPGDAASVVPGAEAPAGAAPADPTAAAPADPFAERVSKIREAFPTYMQGKDATLRDEALYALSVATNPEARPDLREKALTQLESVLSGAGNFTMPTGGAEPTQGGALMPTSTARPGAAGNPQGLPGYDPTVIDGDIREVTPAAPRLPGRPAARLPAPVDAQERSRYEQEFADLVKTDQLDRSLAMLEDQARALHQQSMREREGSERLDEIQQLIEHNRAERTRQERARILSDVLADPTVENHGPRFAAELERAGFRNAAPTPDEAAKIDRFQGLREALFAPPEVVPSTPNELDPYVAPRAPAAPVVTAAAPAPVSATPTTSPAPNDFARRRETIRAAIAAGHTVEKRADGSYLVNPETGEARRLTPAEMQVARNELAKKVATVAANTNTEPTEAQKEKGNYRKAPIKFPGLPVIAIENPKGATRRGVDPDGNAWESTMAHHYGYFKGTDGADNDPVDVFVGPDMTSQKVYVVDQIDPKTGRFDEHKVLAGFTTEASARAGYLANYEPGWQGLGGITEMPVSELRTWLKDGNTKQPIDPKAIRAGEGAATIKPAEVTPAEPDVPRDTGFFIYSNPELGFQPIPASAEPRLIHELSPLLPEVDFILHKSLADDPKPDQAYVLTEKASGLAFFRGPSPDATILGAQQLIEKVGADKARAAIATGLAKTGPAPEPKPQEHPGAQNVGAGHKDTDIEAQIAEMLDPANPRDSVTIPADAEIPESVMRAQTNARRDPGYQMVRQPDSSVLLTTKKAGDQTTVKQESLAGIDAPPASQAPSKKSRTGAQAARDRLKTDNPFLAFIGQFGLNPKDRKDLGQERGQRAIPGFGFVWRNAAPRLDELALLAKESGFLSRDDVEANTDTGGTRKLAEMIQSALAGDTQVTPDSAIAAADTQREAEYLEHLRQQEEAEQEAADERDAILYAEHAAFDDADDTDVPFDLSPVSENQPLTDDEIDRIFSGSPAAPNGRGTQEGADAPTRSRAGDSATPPAASNRGQDEGLTLTSYSPDEIRAQQGEKDAAAKAEAKAQREADDRTRREREQKELSDRRRQDASAENFQLGQDPMESLSGQADIFASAPESNGSDTLFRADPSTSEELGNVTPDTTTGPARAGNDGRQFVSRVDADRVFDGIREQFPDLPKVVIADVFADLPAEIQAEAQAAGKSPNSVKGVLHRGTVYVVLANHSNLADLETTALHEIVGHVGTRRALGPEFRQRLNQLFSQLGGWKGIRAIAEKHGFADILDDYKDDLVASNAADPDRTTEAMARAILSEELIAHIAQEKPGLRQRLQAVIGAIRAALRKMGLAKLAEYNDSDLAHLISQSRKALRDGGPDGSPRGGQPAPAFRAESVDDGLPMFRAAATGDEDAKASLRDRVRQQVSDTFTSQRTFNRWWHKTVGTQYHKAQIDPEGFGRVFNLAQQYIDDVARYASEAADRADGLLPKLETARDAIKGMFTVGRDSADAKAIAKPIFDGTLEDKVYSDQALRAQFGLSDRQIDLYREFRAAVDKSLDDLAISEMNRLAKASKLEAAPKGLTLQQVAQFYHEQFADELAQSQQDLADLKARHEQEAKQLDAAGANTEADRTEYADLVGRMRARQAVEIAPLEARAAELEKMRHGFVDKAEQISDLKKKGYAPLTRFGQYTVDVFLAGEDGKPLRNADGEEIRPFFGMFETQAEANIAARALREEYPEATVAQGVLSQNAYAMFKGVTPETMEIMAQMMGQEQSEAFQRYLKTAVSNRSALKRLIARKGIKGYSDDPTRVLAAFLTSNARAASANDHMGDMLKAAAEIPKDRGDSKDEAVNLVSYLQNPGEEASKLRGILFVNYIGGSVASAMVNMTQSFTMTYPYLHQFGGNTASMMGEAMRLAGRRMFKRDAEIADPDLRAALARATDEGVTSPHEIHTLYGEANPLGLMKGNRYMRNFVKAFGSFFSLAELYNRDVAFIAAYRVAQKQGLDQGAAYDFAKKAVEETQGIYSAANKPNWARGAVGSVLFTFKQFSISYVEFLKRLPAKERAIALGVLLVFAGMQGMPGADDLDDVIDTIAERLGYSLGSKQAKREFITNVFGKDAAGFIQYGVSYGLPLDIAGRMSVGNLIPGTGVAKKSTTDRAKELHEWMGPAGGLLEQAGNAMNADNIGAAFLAMSPKAFRDLAKGYDMISTGEYTDTKGRKVADVSALDSGLKAVGFQPAHLAESGRARGEIYQQANLVRSVESDIVGKWAEGIAKRDPEKTAKAREALVEWNRKNPDAPLPRDLAARAQRRAREMQKTSEDRLIKSVPKEMREQARAALAD